MTQALRLSIVVPTRNRPDHASGCAASILSTDGFADLTFIDQSDGTETEEALSRIQDRRLRYVRTNTRGVTNARNLGTQLGQSEVIAFTDDDCRVKPDWPRRILEVFSGDSSVAVVCGRVCVPEEIRHLGHTESFEPRIREWQGRYPPLGQWGIGANLSLRRSVLDQVGRFDPMLGPGAPLRAGEESDFLFRVLRAGHKVVNAQEVAVDHLGTRKHGEESRNLLKGYGIGTGAALFKHVRLGDPLAALIYLRVLGRTALHVGGRMAALKRPTGAGFLLAFLSGPIESYRFRVDRPQRQFVDR